MDPFSLPSLPLAVGASETLITTAISGLLLLFAQPLASVPGLRPTDGSRNAIMRSLTFLLNLAAIIALAWTQDIVIVKGEWPALLALCAGFALTANVTYVSAKKVAAKNGSNTSTDPTTDSTDTTSPDPADTPSVLPPAPVMASDLTAPTDAATDAPTDASTMAATPSDAADVTDTSSVPGQSVLDGIVASAQAGANTAINALVPSPTAASDPSAAPGDASAGTPSTSTSVLAATPSA